MAIKIAASERKVSVDQPPRLKFGVYGVLRTVSHPQVRHAAIVRTTQHSIRIKVRLR
jgi:hypothetical protein